MPKNMQKVVAAGQSVGGYSGQAIKEYFDNGTV